MKTRTEWLADQASDLASHRFAFPLAFVGWWYFQWTFGDGLQIALMFALLNAQKRGDRAEHVKLDALIKSSESPNDLIGLDKCGEDEIEHKRN